MINHKETTFAKDTMLSHFGSDSVIENESDAPESNSENDRPGGPNGNIGFSKRVKRSNTAVPRKESPQLLETEDSMSIGTEVSKGKALKRGMGKKTNEKKFLKESERLLTAKENGDTRHRDT
jgi:hypothetical protein